MYPTTPRAGGSVYTSTTTATTPRSNRRSTLANVVNSPFRVTTLAPPEFPALPPLNTKKYPLNPYAEDPEFSEVLQQDMDAVDSTVEVLSRNTEEIKRQLREHLTHLESERISYENRIRELGEVAKEMVKNQTKEREEMENAKENETNVNRQTEKLKVKLEGYQQEVKEALTRLQTRRDLKARQVAAFNAQLALNKPELDHFERYLGVKMRGKGQDVVQFKFVHLDRTSYSRSFTFELDVSTSSYSLSSITPTNYLPPPLIQQLIKNLNEKKIDLYSFVREMRFSFCVEIELEKRLGTAAAGSGGGDEMVREKEREKIRSEAEGQ
ncbi:hypothetical protein JCM3765_000094 [Sporobolomyces pararoseus]